MLPHGPYNSQCPSVICNPIGYMVGILVYVPKLKIHKIPHKVVAVSNDSGRDGLILSQKIEQVMIITFNNDPPFEAGGVVPRERPHEDPKP